MGKGDRGAGGVEGQGERVEGSVCSIAIAIRFNLSQAYRIALDPGVPNITSLNGLAVDKRDRLCGSLETLLHNL